jgi:hypothetical protein
MYAGNCSMSVDTHVFDIHFISSYLILNLSCLRHPHPSLTKGPNRLEGTGSGDGDLGLGF